jgi:hypothetical protein
MLRLGHPLARRLLFATVAWQPGFRDLGIDLVLRDFVRPRYGAAGAGGGINYVRNKYGRAVENAVGGGNMDMTWTEINGSYVPTRSLTAFVVLKPLATNSPATSAYFRKKGTSTTEAGWKFDTTGNPDAFLVRVANGASTAAASTITTSSLTRHFALGLRADVERGFLSVWLDGRKEAQSALGFVPTNDAAQPLALFQSFEGQISTAVLWNRPLSDGEMIRLYLDAYALWRGRQLVRVPRASAIFPDRLARKTEVIASGVIPGLHVA